MTRFLNDTMSDIRGGRETWRVFVTLGTSAFTTAVVVTLLRVF
ncbi:MAG: hypothetical protein ACLGH0_14135 [Thermoanaerobaculia bacterium]